MHIMNLQVAARGEGVVGWAGECGGGVTWMAGISMTTFRVATVWGIGRPTLIIAQRRLRPRRARATECRRGWLARGRGTGGLYDRLSG